MDITAFVLSGREEALLYGDYSTYRASLSRRLLAVRRRLGLATKKGAKFTQKSHITAQDVARNIEHVHLILLTSERAWAHAMLMKAAHSGDTNGITGPTRSHIISRLHKAAKTVDDLIVVLHDKSTSNATEGDILEARAYSASLSGAETFEKQSWEACIHLYSEALIIYYALGNARKSDAFKDFISSTVEPSIRYAAYQMKLPRTLAIQTIARRNFPSQDPELVTMVESFDANVLKDATKTQSGQGENASTRTITWRSRTVNLEDATIANSLVAVEAATKKLSDSLSSFKKMRGNDHAGIYDDVLIASQDSVDATKHAIDEMTGQGISQGDPRMQSLQITRTKLSYDLISWRIGRNRILAGEHDGALLDSSPLARPRKSKKVKDTPLKRQEGEGRQLARLREKVALYDSTLQSLESVNELPGVAADTGFVAEVKARHNYFQSLKCLAIARSHAVVTEYKKSLALLVRASELLEQGLPVLSKQSEISTENPLNINISSTSAKFLSSTLQAEILRHRGLVQLHNILTETSTASGGPPLIESLNTYPKGEVDLNNLVRWPPQLEAIPVKPLFFDIAFNYINYPGQASQSAAQVVPQTVTQPATEKVTIEPPKKKGWFGFGRS